MKQLLFLLFPCFIFSQSLPTNGEIYNYDIGDEFHYFDSEEGDCYIFSVTRHTILDKNYSLNSDTIFYQIHQERYYSFPVDLEIDTFYEVSTISLFYTNLLSPVESLTVLDSSTILTYDSISWCNHAIIQLEWCSLCDDLGSTLLKKEYGIGLGEIHESFSSSEDSWDSKKLIYANKINGESCGEPDNRVLNTDFEKRKSLVLYPNPTSSYFTIADEIQFDHLLCFDQSGRMITELHIRNNQVDVSYLETGDYLLLFVKDELFTTRKLFILR